MVTQAIGTALKVAGTVSSVVSALDQIAKARKDCDALAKRGLVVQARKLGAELDRQEAKLKRSLGREITRRVKARSKARSQTRTGGGRFV